MRDVYFLNGDTEANATVKATTEDVRIIVDGPRAPFALVNETNGMTIRYTGVVSEGERLWIEAPTQRCYRREKAKKGATPIPSYEHLHIAPHQQGWGWMRLTQGINRLRIVAL